MSEVLTGAAEDGSLMLEWTFSDGRQVCFFIEEEQLPETVAEVRDGKVYRVKITDAEHLARLLEAPVS